MLLFLVLGEDTFQMHSFMAKGHLGRSTTDTAWSSSHRFFLFFLTELMPVLLPQR